MYGRFTRGRLCDGGFCGIYIDYGIEIYLTLGGFVKWLE